MRLAVRVTLAASLLAVVAAPSCKSSSSAPAPAQATFPSVPTSQTLDLDGLGGRVDMVRDAHGMVHIYATSTADALRVEGYQVARDRTAQLELIRRSAEGRMAEVFGDLSASLIDSDISMRTVGLTREAQALYDALDPKSQNKQWLDAYADGISQFNARVQTGKEEIPAAMIGFPPSALAPWTGVDVLAVARFQAWNLAYEIPDDLDNTSFVATSQATFNASSTDPLVQKRQGFLTDVVRFAPIAPTTVLPGYPGGATASQVHRGGGASPAVPRTRAVDASVLHAASAWSDSVRRVRSLVASGHFGSNDWIVGKSLSANGHALLANDPHLALGAPATFWFVHLNVASTDPTEALDVEGAAFPGLLGVILGFNEHVAWGATDAFFDVSDAFQETFTPDGSAVVHDGMNVPLQKVHEEILVSGGSPVEYDVLVVPHHGPIVPDVQNHAVVPPDPTKGAISAQWTGDQVTHDVDALVGFLRAKTVDDAKTAVESFAIGAENWVFADTNGDIFYSSHAIVPTRDKRAFTWSPSTFTGTLPCFVLPGDGTADWTGTLADQYIPQVKNPADGYVATANNDQVGATLDNDPSNDTLPNGQPFYLQAFYDDPGLRSGRITRDLTTAGHKLTIADMATIQADARSNLGSYLVPQIQSAMQLAETERATPGTSPDLTAIVADPRYAAANVPSIEALFTQWSGTLEYDTPAGVSLDDGSLSTDANEAAASKAALLFNAWIVTMERDTFGDELTKMGVSAPPGAIDLRRSLTFLMTAPDPTKLATYDAASGGSALFDDLTTPAVETKNERTIHALLDAIDVVKAQLGADDSQWRWGKIHTLTFASLVPLWGSLSIPPSTDPVFPNGFPRHGEAWTVDVGDYGDWLDPTTKPLSFAYTNGPVQRFVIDMDPVNGPTAMNVLPGGEVWNNASKHFRDEAELWRRNENHAMPTAQAQVASGADEHIVYVP